MVVSPAAMILMFVGDALQRRSVAYRRWFTNATCQYIPLDSQSESLFWNCKALVDTEY